MGLLDWENGDKFVFLPLIYIVPCLLMYGIVNYIMFWSPSRSRFTGSFYRLFGCSSLLMVTHCVTYFIFVRTGFAPACQKMVIWVKDVPIFKHGMPFLCYYSVYGQFICNTAMSFNRFTVFSLKTAYGLFWRKALIPVMCVIFVPPACLCWHILAGSVTVEPDKYVKNAFVWDTKTDFTWWRTNRVSLVLILSTAVSSFIMNMYVVVQFIIQLRFRPGAKKKATHEDSMMFALTLSMFALQLVEAALQVMFLFPMSNDVVVAVFTYQVFLVDIKTLLPVWSLILTSREVRAALKGQTNVSTAFRET